MSIGMGIFLFFVICVLTAPLIVFIAMKGDVKIKEMEAVKAQIETLDNQILMDLVQEIREENASLKDELNEIKKVLSSIDKMMKDID